MFEQFTDSEHPCSQFFFAQVVREEELLLTSHPSEQIPPPRAHPLSALRSIVTSARSAMETWMDDNELARHEDYVARESAKREVARQEIKRTEEMAQRDREDEQARCEAEQARGLEERKIVRREAERREAERRTKEAEEDFVTTAQAGEMEESTAHPGALRAATLDAVMRQISFHAFVQSRVGARCLDLILNDVGTV